MNTFPSPSDIKLGCNNVNENTKFHDYWRLQWKNNSLDHYKEYSITTAFSPLKFGTWTSSSLNHCSGRLYIMVLVFPASEGSKFSTWTCRDFSWMNIEVAVSVKTQKTQHRTAHRTSGRKNTVGFVVAISTLPPCEMSQEKSLEQAQLPIIALLYSRKHL